MQLSVDAQKLQVKGVFIFCQASNGSPIAQTHRDCPVGRSGSAASRSAPAASSRGGWHAPGVAERLFYLGFGPVASHVGEVGTEHAAAALHHMAASAIPFPCKESRARGSVAVRGSGRGLGLARPVA